MPTPYDGKVALWYVHGNTVGERTIDDIISVIKQFAPAVNALYVKVGEGTLWMGNIGAGDPKVDLAIRGPEDIDRWVRKLAAANIDFHGWYIPRGQNPTAEADFLLQACNRPGVKSMILDVEPFDGYFTGGRAAVRPLMLRLKSGLRPDFHIGMSVDPRPWHYDSIFPDEWRPFVDSLHPQLYWADFNQTPSVCFQQAYRVWGAYGLPIIPVLQGYQGRGAAITRNSMEQARLLADEQYRVPGLSWFRFGTLNRTLYPAVNVGMDGSVPGGTPPTNIIGRYGTTHVVKPGEVGYQDGTYDGAPNPMRIFQNEEGWESRYLITSSTGSTVYARWEPPQLEAGLWEISAYIPSQHATTRSARYKIHGVVNQPTEIESSVRQIAMDSMWVPLGIHNFAGRPGDGVVFLNDLTGEDNREIAFDALRWRQVIGWNARAPRFLADGFDSPVGTAQERDSQAFVYPPTWIMTLGYGVQYVLLGQRTSLHTGEDVVIAKGKTLGQQLYAVASGVVTVARREGTGSWGNIVVIRHDPLVSTGQIIYSRYGHVDNMQVRPGERVARGQHIADIGDAFGLFRNAVHLHFDISPTRVFEVSPGDWPWMDRARINRDYLAPSRFIGANRPPIP
jgi:murein DD-endopeptidase MepM/ murein hydrolase activator NlpD